MLHIRGFRILLTAVIGVMFGTSPASAGVKVKETSVLTIDQALINSQLRNALRQDIKFGVINVYDGSKWVSGETSIHFDLVKIDLLEAGMKISLAATINSPLGRRSQKIEKVLSVADVNLVMDVDGSCNMLVNLASSVIAASDVITDMYPGSQSSPIGLLKNTLSSFKVMEKFAAYTKGVAIERCYPASFTGVADMSLALSTGKVKITLSPELEYLTLDAKASGSLSGTTVSIKFVSNFPLAFRAGGADASFRDAAGRLITVKLSSIASTLSQSADGKNWTTTASGTYTGPKNGVFPDVLFDLESPCGELVQRYKVTMLSPIMAMNLNSSAGIP